MATTVNWATGVISIPRADMTLIQASPEVRQLDVAVLHTELRTLQAAVEGAYETTTHNHTQVSVLSGISYARVVEILSPYTVEFEDGQYTVASFNANHNLGDVKVANQVSLVVNNSAGLTFSEQINNQSFEGASVWVDTINGSPGTAFPKGTPTDPVDNIMDARIILDRLKMRSFRINGAITLMEDMIGCVFTSIAGSVNTTISLAGFDVDTSQFNDVTLAGTGTGAIEGTAVKMDNVNGLSGTFKFCGVVGFMTPGTGSSTFFIDCYSAIPGNDRPVLDLVNGASDDILIRRWSGGLCLDNIDQPDQLVSVDMAQGTLELLASCTAGLVVRRGIIDFIDNSNGTTVVERGALSKDDIWNGITLP